MSKVECDFHVCEQKAAGVRMVEEVDGENREGKRDVIIGHAAVFYREDETGTEYQLGRWMRERIAKGAFDGAMKRPDDVRALRDHDASLLLGRTTNGTLRLSVDERGLAFEIDPDSTTVGTDTRKMIRRGDLTGASFGFVVERESFEDDGDEVIRTVESTNPLVDVSPVTFPAFTATDTVIGKRKQEMFCERLKGYIAEHRDEDVGRRLETRAAKFGIVVPKSANPDAIAKAAAEARRRHLRLLEAQLER